MRSWVMAFSRKVRWSRKKRMLSGSTTRPSSPTFSSKKMADMGVTYSWLKRRSVRKKPASPGRTQGTPTSSRAASTTQWEAKIFSATVMGRTVEGTAEAPTPPSRSSAAPARNPSRISAGLVGREVAATWSAANSPGRSPSSPLPRSWRFSVSSPGSGTLSRSASSASAVSPGGPPRASGRGTVAFPWSRATLNSKRPPYSMIWRVISSFPRVKTSRGISSPARIRRSTSKSVVVRIPRFWQFSL